MTEEVVERPVGEGRLERVKRRGLVIGAAAAAAAALALQTATSVHADDGDALTLGNTNPDPTIGSGPQYHISKTQVIRYDENTPATPPFDVALQ